LPGVPNGREGFPHLLDGQFSDKAGSEQKGSGRLRHVSGKLLWIQDQTSSKTEGKQISTLLNIGDVGRKPSAKARLHALMFWCKIYDKDGNQVGEAEANRVKETSLNKAKIMRVAQLLQKVVIFGGLEQGLTVNLFLFGWTCRPSHQWRRLFFLSTLFLLLFVAVLVGFFIVYKAYRSLQQELRQALAELRLRQDRMMENQSDLINEIGMHHIHITKMHVALIRLGGYVQFEQPITEQDWDNWRYIERGNRVEDDRVCRRCLRSLKLLGGGRRRRRHSTPTRTNQGADGGENAPENMSAGEYQRRLDPSDPEE
jgi:hypothetical protein